jgi:23S rRNA pseudouridine955/2504/2580 synthase
MEANQINKIENSLSHVKHISISSEEAGQRLGNFLLRIFKNVPKSRIYKAIRTGEVRVNKGRSSPDYKLQVEDIIRIPPIQQDETPPPKLPVKQSLLDLLSQRIIYEDTHIIVLNKPAGIPVHGGSGVSYGIIEAMRILRPQLKVLDLAHRLDRDTSGCLLLAKKNSALRKLHALFRENKVTKIYTCLCKGVWRGDMQRIKSSLLKHQLQSGEHNVIVSEEGKASLTTFRVIQRFENMSLMSAELGSGRTHQIRVHAASVSHPLAADDRYGDKEFNQELKKRYGLKRLFLHARQLRFISPADDVTEINIESPLDSDLQKVFESF